MAYSTADLAEGLSALGLSPGDTVLVRAGLGAIGSLAIRHPGKALVAALREAVGPEGTLVGLAFTKIFPDPIAHPDQVFAPSSRPTTGGLARTLLGLDGAVRSTHPTNSWVAVGPAATELLAGHDHTAACFEPVRGLVERNAIMLLVGCVNDSPGFSTVHLAQHDLGLSSQNRIAPLGVLHQPDGATEPQVFIRSDTPGCSAGFHKLYAHYEGAGHLRRGLVGDAPSAAIRARDAIAVERVLLEANPRFPLCDAPGCAHCRGALLYNKRDWPAYKLRKLLAKFRA